MYNMNHILFNALQQKKLQTTEKIQRYELRKQAIVDKKGEFKKLEEAEIARRIVSVQLIWFKVAIKKFQVKSIV